MQKKYKYELKGIKHGINMATYFGKLLKPTSCCPYTRAKYFNHYINQTHFDITKFINYLLKNIKYCKSQRKKACFCSGAY